MKLMLTSSLGATKRVNGKKLSSKFIERNGLLEHLQAIWPDNANVLLLGFDPDSYENNDKRIRSFKESFNLSNLSVNNITFCDNRNKNVVVNLSVFQVIVLIGGHVPTQNRFYQQIELREKLVDYDGLVVAWSAGSMNCADFVYAAPEYDDEVIDPTYERWLPGLGLTNINILPHFQNLKHTVLAGKRLIEDITFADSMGRQFIALCDGSFIMIDESNVTLHGEAYMIKDGMLRQICKDNETLSIEYV